MGEPVCQFAYGPPEVDPYHACPACQPVVAASPAQLSLTTSMLAWLYLYEATAAVAHMNTIVTTAVCSRWDESMICGQPSAWDPEPVYFVHKGHGHRHQE